MSSENNTIEVKCDSCQDTFLIVTSDKNKDTKLHACPKCDPIGFANDSRPEEGKKSNDN